MQFLVAGRVSLIGTRDKVGVSISHEQQRLVDGEADHPDRGTPAEDRQQGSSSQGLNQKQKEGAKKNSGRGQAPAIQQSVQHGHN
jgi:hypothetical protein